MVHIHCVFPGIYKFRSLEIQRSGKSVLLIMKNKSYPTLTIRFICRNSFEETVISNGSFDETPLFFNIFINELRNSNEIFLEKMGMLHFLICLHLERNLRNSDSSSSSSVNSMLCKLFACFKSQM